MTSPSSAAPCALLPGRLRAPAGHRRWLVGAALAMPVLAGLAAAAGKADGDAAGLCLPHEPSVWLLVGPAIEECALRAGFQNGLRELWPGARRHRLDAWLAGAVHAVLLWGHRHPAQLVALAVASLLIGLVHARLRDRAEACGGSVFAGLPQAIGLHALFNLSLLLAGGGTPPPLIPPLPF